MSSFTKPLVGSWNDSMTLFTLTEEFDYYETDQSATYKVPAGFITDFASTPKALHWLIPPTGLYGKAAVIHDFLYTPPHQVSKQDADRIFKDAMLVLDVPRWKAELMYLAVKFFGSKAYASIN